MLRIDSQIALPVVRYPNAISVHLAQRISRTGVAGVTLCGEPIDSDEADVWYNIDQLDTSNDDRCCLRCERAARRYGALL